MIISAVGAGVSYVAQSSAAREADALARLNMDFQRQTATQNAALQAQAQQMQAAQAQAQAALQNIQAGAVTQRTEAESRQAQDNIRRAREASEAMRARLRAGAGASGVNPDTASPLDLVASEAAAAAEDAMWQRDADEMRRKAGALDAIGIKAGAVQSSLQAGFLTAAADNSIVEGRLAGRQAALNYYGQRAQNNGVRAGALGGLISSAGSFAGDYYQFRNARNVTYKPE
jgi:hypothetical protein